MAATRTAMRGRRAAGAGAGTAELGMMLGGLGTLLLVAGATKRQPQQAQPVVHVLPFGRVLTAEELATDNLPSVDEIAGDIERRSANGGYDQSHYFYEEGQGPADEAIDAEHVEAEPLQLGDGSEREALESLIVETHGEPAEVES